MLKKKKRPPVVAVMPKSSKVPTWAGTVPSLSRDHMWHAPLHSFRSVPTSNPPPCLCPKICPFKCAHLPKRPHAHRPVQPLENLTVISPAHPGGQ